MRRWPTIVNVATGVFALVAAVNLWRLFWGDHRSPAAASEIATIMSLAGLFLTAIFGAIGTATTLRTRQGRLTPWGIAAIFGTAVGFLTASSSQVAQHIASKREAAETTAFNADMLSRLQGVAKNLGAQAASLGQTSKTLQQITQAVGVVRVHVRMDIDGLLPQGYVGNLHAIPDAKGVEVRQSNAFGTNCAEGFPSFGIDDAFLREAVNETAVFLAFLPEASKGRLLDELSSGGAWNPYSSQRYGLRNYLPWKIAESGRQTYSELSIESLRNACNNPQDPKMKLGFNGDEDLAFLEIGLPDYRVWRGPRDMQTLKEIDEATLVFWMPWFSQVHPWYQEGRRPDFIALSFGPQGERCFDSTHLEVFAFNDGYVVVASMSKAEKNRLYC